MTIRRSSGTPARTVPGGISPEPFAIMMRIVAVLPTIHSHRTVGALPVAPSWAEQVLPLHSQRLTVLVVRFLGEMQKPHTARGHSEVCPVPLSGRNLTEKIVPYLAKPLRVMGAPRERLRKCPAPLAFFTFQNQDAVLYPDGSPGSFDDSPIAP